MNRILVVGTTGSGKTTVSGRLAGILGLPHVELDALFWNPGWVQTEVPEFRARVGDATSGDRWVSDGNYFRFLDDLLWERADTVVWLDPPLPLIVVRLVRRTIRRSLLRTELWGGNRERLSNLWNKEKSLVVWAYQTHGEHRSRYGAAMRDLRWGHIAFVRLGSKRDVRRWLSKVSRTAPLAG